MAIEITKILLSAQSPDGQERRAAEETLKQFQEQNLPHFLLSMSVELSNDQKPPESRWLAGIILKNSLDAKDSIRKEELSKRWVYLDPSIKAQIKESLLQTLGSSVSNARRTSSQVIAKIASIEIPRREWQNLIERLLINIGQHGASESLKQATLETLGYVCEGVSYKDLEQNEVNAVLTAVVQGMTQPEYSFKVRLAAVRSLYNALEFAQTNFDNEHERNYIMKVLCEAAVSEEVEIRKTALECLVSISSMYYEILGPYMEALFSLTANAVKADEESVALQALEFWSSICVEEIGIQEKYGGHDVVISAAHSHFVEKALPLLVPMLLATLLKQEEDQDEEDGTWKLSMSAGTCLGLVAWTVGDAIVPLVMPFVEENITKPEWQNREAATFAFGCILEGPSVENLAPLVHSGLGFLLGAMKDQNSHVKETTAWTLGRIFEVLHCSNNSYPIITGKNLPCIVSVLLESISDSSNVSEKVCGAIYYLAHGYEDAVLDSSLLVPYLTNIVAALLSAADRMDNASSRLRASAYETLNEIVRCSKLPEASNMIGQLLLEIMARLSKTVDLQILSLDDREKQSALQALLCGVLQVIVQKLSLHEVTRTIILQAADRMMVLFLQVFACRSFTVHEEAMLAIGALAYATGAEFAKYMPGFSKYLEMGLQNFEEYQVCSISVGVVGDICRALDEKVLPYCDDIMTHLLKDLSNPVLHPSVKPPIFACFGDIALAIGENFEKYLKYAMPMLEGASEHCATLDAYDENLVEYGNQLRHGIFEAYSGILQGFKSSKAHLMLPYGNHLLRFTEAVSRDKNRDGGVTKAAVAAMGDFADALGPHIQFLFKDCTFHVDLLGECLESVDDQLKETATWTQGMIERAMVSWGDTFSL